MPAGTFIVIDGTDGSGKGTQTTRLVERLKAEGRDVVMFDFPRYGKSSAHFVEKYLRKEISRPALAESMEAINTIRIKPKRKRLPYRTSVAIDSLQSPPLAPSEEPIQAQNEEKQ